MIHRTWAALILDMDGVVVDTEPLIFASFRRIFAPLGISLPDAYLFQLVGDSTEKNMADISRTFSVQFDVDLYVEKLRQDYFQVLESVHIPLRQGIGGLLAAAKKRGLKIGLCTSSRSGNVEVIMRRIGASQGLTLPLREHFDAIITGDMVKRKKPDPEPYQLACRTLQVEPARSVVIEDSIAGVQSAKTAGCYCIGLLTEYNRHRDFSQADKSICHLTELTEGDFFVAPGKTPFT